MLLSERTIVFKRRLTGDDSGFVLAGVLGLLLLVLLLSSIVMTSVLNGLSITASSRSVVQSQAAAEAGVDVVRAIFRSSGQCSTATSGTGPTFTATVSYSTTESNPGASSSDWIPGCPTARATWARIISVGTPASDNPLNDRATLTRAVEGIFFRAAGTSTFTYYSSRNVVTP